MKIASVPESTDEIQVIRSSRGSYSSSIPHIADDELSLYEYRLYGHYCRVCDEGWPCVEPVRATAKHCGMSSGMIINARDGLEEKGYIAKDIQGSGRGAKCFVTLLDIEEKNLAHGKKLKKNVHGVNINAKNVHPMNNNSTKNVRGVNIKAKNVHPTNNNDTKNVHGVNINDQNTPDNVHPMNIPGCTTTVEEVDLLLDLTNGSSSTVVQDPERLALSQRMLEECGIFPADALLFALQHPFEHLRQWVFDWRNNPKSQGPGLLRHIIAQNFRRGELTSADKHTEFYQRYRSPAEIAAERLAELAWQQEAPAPIAVAGDEAGGDACADLEGCKVWGLLLSEFKLQLPSDTFNAYVRDCSLLERIAGDTELWVIGVRNKHSIDWLENRMSNKIRRALASLVRYPVALAWRVLP